MASSRAAASSSYHSRLRIPPRRAPHTISVYVLLLLVFSAVLFLFSQRQITDVDQKNLQEERPQDWDRYLTVRSNGGLNQMRTGICDMVAVARIMNATLVVPQLDKKSFWQDSSTFADIFDETHFIKSLEGDVRIVKELPKEMESIPRARKHFSSWASMSYYEEMARLWKDYKVIHVPKSDSRLANNDLPLDIQKLRCRCLYHALHFSPPIETLGKV
ncbi:hypothetical protein Taro_001227 [Colocasia esculenta]|uniref:O-fucosyltransferase family protein n=1 Tax=Colocasia esculenta TaxID=4460 RepID=A0A843TAF6_COLES|nr:hypothetical protein [Colocasia esculenta]